MFIIFVRLRRSQQLGPDAMALHAAARITGEAPPLFSFLLLKTDVCSLVVSLHGLDVSCELILKTPSSVQQRLLFF